MKNGTVYAGKLKKAYTKLRQTVGSPGLPDPDAPLRRLAVAILGVGSSDHAAERALDRALTSLVDWNDVRASSASELNRATGNSIPQGTERCQRLIDALQSIFDRENELSLDRLKTVGRREARHYLEGLQGVDEYATASVILWSLGGHAIPVNDRLLQSLREADLVNPTAGRAEVQAFLERHIGATEAKRFSVIMQSFAKGKPSSSKRAKATQTAKATRTSRSK